jgi:hypothetical protein
LQRSSKARDHLLNSVALGGERSLLLLLFRMRPLLVSKNSLGLFLLRLKVFDDRPLLLKISFQFRWIELQALLPQKGTYSSADLSQLVHQGLMLSVRYRQLLREHLYGLVRMLLTKPRLLQRR